MEPTISVKKGRWINYKREWKALQGKPDRVAPKESAKRRPDVNTATDPDGLTLTPKMQGIREKWKETITTRTNARVFMTVGSKLPWNNAQAITTVNFLLKCINSSVFNHDYGRDPNAGFTGVCICEPHMLSYDFRGQLHFHILLDDHPALKDIDGFKKIVGREMRRAKTTLGLHYFSDEVVDVQEIKDREELANVADYLTKTSRMHIWKYMENICFVGPQGLSGIGVSYKGNARNY